LVAAVHQGPQPAAVVLEPPPKPRVLRTGLHDRGLAGVVGNPVTAPLRSSPQLGDQPAEHVERRLRGVIDAQQPELAQHGRPRAAAVAQREALVVRTVPSPPTIIDRPDGRFQRGGLALRRPARAGGPAVLPSSCIAPRAAYGRETSPYRRASSI